MSGRCAYCGIGERLPGGVCDWCAAPVRVRTPLWIAARRRLQRSRLAGALRRWGPVATGVVVGMLLHLAVAALGVVAGIPALWQMGLFWSVQWWWALVPEGVQPWAFAAVRGAAYGALAGWVLTTWRAAARSAAESPLPARKGRLLLSPATVTALAAFVLAGWDSFAGTQHQLVAAALGAAVGRLTELMGGDALAARVRNSG